MRLLLPALSAAVSLVALPGGASADDVPGGCAGVTVVAPSCTFVYQGAPLVYQAQNVRVVTGGIIFDDKVTLTLYNVTQAREVARCTATGVAAGCGSVFAPAGTLVAGDVVRCTASGQGAVTTTYVCA